MAIRATGAEPLPPPIVYVYLAVIVVTWAGNWPLMKLRAQLSGVEGVMGSAAEEPTVTTPTASPAGCSRAFRVERDRGFADSPLEQAGFEPSVPARTAVACPPISLDSSSTKTTSGVRASRARFGQLADQRVALRYR